MSWSFRSPVRIVGSRWASSKRRSMASRVDACSRSIALSLRSQLYRSCGILDHRLQDALKRLLGERPGFGLTNVRDGRRPRKLVVQLPPIVGEIEPRDIVEGAHQVEIDDAFHDGCGGTERLHHRP